MVNAAYDDAREEIAAFTKALGITPADRKLVEGFPDGPYKSHQTYVGTMIHDGSGHAVMSDRLTDIAARALTVFVAAVRATFD